MNPQRVKARVNGLKDKEVSVTLHQEVVLRDLFHDFTLHHHILLDVVEKLLHSTLIE